MKSARCSFIAGKRKEWASSREQKPSTVTSEESARPRLRPSDSQCTWPCIDLVSPRGDVENGVTTDVCVTATRVPRDACTHLIVTTCVSASSRRERAGRGRSTPGRTTDRPAASSCLERKLRRKTNILPRLPGDSWSLITIRHGSHQLEPRLENTWSSYVKNIRHSRVT